MPRRIDITGQKFGELTVIGYSHSHIQPSGQKRAIWDVRCSCGVVKKASTANLKYGTTVSCGHVLKATRHTFRKLPDNQAEKNYLYIAYKHSASNRGIDFRVSKDEFLKIIQEDCFYCGAKPRNVRKSKSASGSNFLYNGIDRFDNNQGYVEGNLVGCCMTCNYMKRDLKVEEFIDHLQKVIRHVKERI